MEQLPSVEATVFDAIAEACTLPLSQISVELNIQDLGLDSWALTAVVARVEAAHGIMCTSEQVVDLLQAQTVGEIVAMIKRLASVPA